MAWPSLDGLNGAWYHECTRGLSEGGVAIPVMGVAGETDDGGVTEGLKVKDAEVEADGVECDEEEDTLAVRLSDEPGSV